MIYGVCVHSWFPLPFPEALGDAPPGLDLYPAAAGGFGSLSSQDTQPASWYRYRILTDGSVYLHWTDLFEFLVSPDGRRVACHPLPAASLEVFHTYLVGQVLSVALAKRGREPLHATAAVVDGGVVAFLGDCGYGKSSLGAAFLQGGFTLLTDDLLILEREGDHYLAHPGPSRIKLFPEMARSLLGEQGDSVPMNQLTPKRILRLDPPRAAPSPAPLRAIYVLRPPKAMPSLRRITIRPLSARAAYLELLRNTFTTLVRDRDRLKRQFLMATELASRVPVRSLSYPRRLDRLPSVRAAILSNLRRDAPRVA